MPAQLNLGLTAVAFISPQNHPILVRALSGSSNDNLLKYHYLAHTSLDVIEERGKPPPLLPPLPRFAAVQPNRPKLTKA